MGIIGILVALLFPAVAGAKRAAEKADAQRMVASLETAVKAYVTEYGRLPLQNEAKPEWEYGTNDATKGYVKLIRTLRGLDTQANPKGVPFLDIPDKKLIDTGSLAGAMVDPWDSTFRVFSDWDNDNIIQTGSSGPYGEIRGHQVVVWSPGPDRTDGTTTGSGVSNRNDNVTSWGG